MVLQESGCVQGMGVRKEEGMGRKPWVFLLVHSTLIDIRNRTFPKALVPPVTRVGALKTSCRLVAISHNNNFETFAHGHLFTRPAGWK